MSDFDALLLAVLAVVFACLGLAACGVLRVQLQRPTGKQRQAWRDGGRRG